VRVRRLVALPTTFKPRAETARVSDNTYSDGREVMVQIRIEPGDSPDFSWKHNGVLLGEGAVNKHPLGTICDIAPVNPHDEQ
jgi:hypothetical protein